MKRAVILFAAIAVGIVFSVSSGWAEKGFSVQARGEKRLALVIGNATYKSSPLKNTINDANDMENALRNLNFEVIARVNAGHKDMEDAIREFGAKLRKADVGLFYYSGHGIQYNGVNFLIPADAEIDKETDLKYKAVQADMVLDEMDAAKNRMNIVILDACRNNPFPRSFRSARQGLAQMSAPSGMLIAYATSPDSVASDGSGRNGTYTENLLKYMTVPGLKIEELFKKVRIGVLQDSSNKQRPWESVSITDDFYFASSDAVPNVPTKPSEPAPVVNPSVSPKLSKEGFTNSLGMKFVYIPPGTFMMGSPPDEPERFNNETQHKVTLTKDFYMQTREVTQGQWKAIMGNNLSKFSDCGDNCPVEGVSWNDVQEFIKKLNQKGEGTYRLPTEAEWEYAARSGTTTAYYWGDSTDCSKANYGNGFSSECKGSNPGKTMSVGSFSPNAYGLYDMHGNVWEWVQDWHGDYPSGAVTDPAGPDTASSRILRGGGWGDPTRYCRSAIRAGAPPGDRSSGSGFRLVILK